MHQNCSCPSCVGVVRADYYATSPWYFNPGEAWHRVIPKRKSGEFPLKLRDPSQRRMLKYNYRCQHPHEYLEIWQVESTVHPRHLRWARRKREALRTAGHRCRRRQGSPKGVKSLVAWLGTEEK